jgi:hypothetical protein
MKTLDENFMAALRAAATSELALALRLINAHDGSLIYSREVTIGRRDRLILSVHLPGILRVADAETGHVLAESVPGDMLTLAPGFEPKWPV